MNYHSPDVSTTDLEAGLQHAKLNPSHNKNAECWHTVACTCGDPAHRFVPGLEGWELQVRKEAQ